MPVVLVCANRIENFDSIAVKFIHDTFRSLTDIAQSTPLLMPAIGRDFDPGRVLDKVEGLVLTGSRSHVSPRLYGQEQKFDDKHLDRDRDNTAFALINAALDRDLPILAICRGFQELNVACGGALHQCVHSLPHTKNDHSQREAMSLEENLHHRAHDVILEKDGVFQKMGLPDRFAVNSLHTQCIADLGEGLQIEAKSCDGVIEAAAMPDKRFVVGMQWHPEGDTEISPPSSRLFEAFGEALRQK